MEYIIRSLEKVDEPFLWSMLYEAIYTPRTSAPLPCAIIYRPPLMFYVRDWGKDGDLGYLAMLKDGQQPVGASWLRLFSSDEPGYGYLDESIPELSISVLPEYRGLGIGTRLLECLLERARTRYSFVSLSVSPGNPALRLYRRFGFEAIACCGDSLTMRKKLC